MSYHLLRKVLTSANAERLTEIRTKSSHVIIQPVRGNILSVFIGDLNVAIGYGYELVAPYADPQMNHVQQGHLRLFSKGGDTIDLHDLFAIGGINQAVNVLYEKY